MNEFASRLADGEQSAWAELYDATADSLFHYVTSLSGGSDATSEILQETFVRLFRCRERLQRVEDLKAFVFRVTRNETNRWLSQRARRPNSMQLDKQLAWQADDSNDLKNEDTELLRHAVDRLSIDQREIVHLKVDCEFTFAQIAEILELPAGTCASRYRRASQDHDKVSSIESYQHHWFARIERIASFTAPCLLLFSLAIFALVDQSTSNLLSPNQSQTVVDSAAPIVRSMNRFKGAPAPTTPVVFLTQHFHNLQALNSELFHETSKTNSQVDRDSPPLGHFRRDFGCCFIELAGVAPRGSSVGPTA